MKPFFSTRQVRRHILSSHGPQTWGKISAIWEPEATVKMMKQGYFRKQLKNTGQFILLQGLYRII
jgi:hypothetical protein